MPSPGGAKFPADLPRFLIPGDHELYNGDVVKTEEAMRAAAAKTPILNCNHGYIAHGGHHYRLLGCTLWMDLSLRGEARSVLDAAQAQIKDYKKITWTAAGAHQRCKTGPSRYCAIDTDEMFGASSIRPTASPGRRIADMVPQAAGVSPAVSSRSAAELSVRSCSP